MNILQIISKNERYGAQRIFLDQIAALHRLGHNVTVVVRGAEGYVTDSVRAMGLLCHGIPMTGIKDIGFLRKLIRDNLIDIIHTTLDRADLFGLAAALITGRPIVSTMMVPRYHLGYRLMNRVVVLANKQAELLSKYGVTKNKIKVIRPGIDVSRFSRPDPEKRAHWKKKLSADAFTMIFCHVSSLHTRKAHLVSLELIKECKKRGESPLLVIMGDPLEGPYYNAIVKRGIELGIEANIYFTGWTSDIPEILSLSHFTVLPSENEALGVALMEGMAAGTPIIVKTGEGGAELIAEYEAGFLYDPEEGIPRLADRLVTLKKNRARYDELSQRCRTNAESNFSLSQFGQRLIELYTALL